MLDNWVWDFSLQDISSQETFSNPHPNPNTNPDPTPNTNSAVLVTSQEKKGIRLIVLR